jgi:hypothetical protein
MLNLGRYAVQFELMNLKGRRQLLVLGKALADRQGDQQGKQELDRQIEEIDRGTKNLRESGM